METVVKQGWKTSEFWTVVGVIVVPILVTLSTIDIDALPESWQPIAVPIMSLAHALSAAVASLGYSNSRAQVKTAATPKAPASP